MLREIVPEKVVPYMYKMFTNVLQTSGAVTEAFTVNIWYGGRA